LGQGKAYGTLVNANSRQMKLGQGKTYGTLGLTMNARAARARARARSGCVCVCLGWHCKATASDPRLDVRLLCQSHSFTWQFEAIWAQIITLMTNYHLDGFLPFYLNFLPCLSLTAPQSMQVFAPRTHIHTHSHKYPWVWSW